MVNNWINIARSALFPRHCPLTDEALANAEALSPWAQALLSPVARPCHSCGIALPGTSGDICGQCLRRPPPFTHTIAPFAYGPPLDHLLIGLKFHRRLELVSILAELWLPHFHGRKPDLIVPIPLHRSRLRERGFNQAGELAGAIAEQLAIPLSRALRRTRATTAQSGLDLTERKRNLRGAFTWQGEAPPEHVTLFDDIMTTGATAAEATRVLKRAGAKRVDVWAIARTL